MAAITNFTLAPPIVACGGRLDITVVVAFVGPPAPVTVMCEIEPPCSFGLGGPMVAMQRTGPSPETFRFSEAVVCPTGSGTTAPQIRITASDANGADVRTQSVVVQSC